LPFISISFLFLFLPISIAFHFFAARFGERARLCALILISFALFALWDIRAGIVLAGSVVVNMAIGRLLQQARDDEHAFQTNMFLFLGIGFNLGILAVFRYENFLIDNTNSIFGAGLEAGKLFAPLGVLFFCCDQIAYLIDLKRGKTPGTDPIRYTAFASFFPRLIAGPLVRYEQIAPQWKKLQIDSEDLATGLATFGIGLAKTVLLGGAVAPYAIITFSAAAAGERIDLVAAWTGVLAFACQIYFDLSGYADMAIGIGRCFGIRLPVNYRSPYRASNITEFWQRWNISLADFLRDYVYRPLGGNRDNTLRASANMVVTMVVAGLWYGAGRMFVAWALLHSFYLFLHRIWRVLGSSNDAVARFRATKTARELGVVLTFLAVTLAWIVFRVPDSAAGLNLFAALFGQYGTILPSGMASFLPQDIGILFIPMDSGPLIRAWLSIAVCLIVIFVFPNTDTLLSSFSPLKGDEEERPTRFWPLRWRASPFWAVALGAVAFAVLASPDGANAALHWRF